MKKILTIIVCILFLTGAASYIISKLKTENKIEIVEGAVNFIIEPEFKDYLKNQAVWVKATLINKTSEPYKIIEPLTLNNFIIIDPNGNRLTQWGSIDYASLDTFLLFPEQPLELIITLNPYFWSNEYTSDNLVGKYSISATYQEIESNIAMISIRYPTGKDLEIFNNSMKGMAVGSYNIEILENLVRENINSPYSPQLSYKILMYHYLDEKNYEKAGELFDYYFAKFNNYYNGFIFHDYSSFLNYTLELPPDIANNKLNEVKSRYHGTKLIEYEDVYQEALEFKETNNARNFH